MQIENIVIRHCERCKRATRQRIEWRSWFEVRTICLALVAGEKDCSLTRCEEMHIFTLSHLRTGSELNRPFTRQDLGIVVREEK